MTTGDTTTCWGEREASAHKNKSSTSGTSAAVEAIAMQQQWRLRRTMGGGCGVDGGVGNGVGGIVATVG